MAAVSRPYERGWREAAREMSERKGREDAHERGGRKKSGKKERVSERGRAPHAPCFPSVRRPEAPAIRRCRRRERARGSGGDGCAQVLPGPANQLCQPWFGQGICWIG
eukprot:3566974-Rhodomonas_salina.1